MRVEGRDLINLGQGEPHLGRQSSEMRGREMTVTILDEMQMLDQQIAPALAVAKQRPYFFAHLRLDLTALWGARRPAPPASTAVAAIGRHSRRRAGEAH